SPCVGCRGGGGYTLAVRRSALGESVRSEARLIGYATASRTVRVAGTRVGSCGRRRGPVSAGAHALPVHSDWRTTQPAPKVPASPTPPHIRGFRICTWIEPGPSVSCPDCTVAEIVYVPGGSVRGR